MATSLLFFEPLALFLDDTFPRSMWRTPAQFVQLLLSFALTGGIGYGLCASLKSEQLNQWGHGARIAVTLILLTGLTALILLIRAQNAATFRKHLRTAESDLRTSKERFERALQGASCGLWEWNFSADMFWISPRFKELLGYTDNEISNTLTAWEAALHPDDRPAALIAISNHIFDKGAYDAEYRLRTKSGQYRWFHVRGLTICDPTGQPYLVSGSIQDIQDRKSAEEAIRRRDEYLRHKQKMEAIGQLASGVAHEFNNLLQAISGCVQFARNSDCGPSAVEDLATADTLIQQAADITRQLLDFSRRKPTNLAPRDTAEFLDKVGVVIRAMLPPAIRLHVDVEPGTSPILADSTLLQQALVNLCINAKDAMLDEGDLVIGARNEEITHAGIASTSGLVAGPYVAITVADNGCGIPADVLDRIFEPFFTTKQPGKGTGLGLAIVYGVVQDHGGTVLCDSQPTRGSTFTLLIPAAPAPADISPKEPRWQLADGVGPTTKTTCSERELITIAGNRQSLERSMSSSRRVPNG